MSDRIHSSDDRSIENEESMNINEAQVSDSSPEENESDSVQSYNNAENDVTEATTDNQENLASLKSSKRHLSVQDANSIVGGQTINEDLKEPLDFEDTILPAGMTPNAEVVDEDSNEKYHGNQKVFSFSLPFGGLSDIKSVYKQISSIKLESSHKIVPKLNIIESSKPSDEFSRRSSMSTLEEARYFSGYKGVADVRMRAVKHSLTPSFNEKILDMLSTKKLKPHESIYNDIKGNIVILGGYRGSILRNTKTGRRVWVPIKAGLHLRRVNLLLGPRPEDELHAEDTIYADGILKNIGPVDICKKLINKLRANPYANVKEFGYDWRLSGNLLALKLKEFLSDIYNETGEGTIVIAHSMGGMIAQSAMQKDPKLFRGLLYVGCPSETLNILGPLRFGDSVLFSDKILTFETNFMMRSSFNFLPLSGKVFFNRETHKYYELDLFNPETWVTYNLNPLVSSYRKRQLETESESQSIQTKLLGDNHQHSSPFGLKILNYRATLNLRGRLRIPSPVLRSEKSPPSRFDKSPSPDNDSSSLYEVATSGLSEESFSFSFEEAYNYLKETLSSTKKFLLGLKFDEKLENEYPPLAIVYGNTVPSVRGSLVDSAEDIKSGNYYHFFYGHGDGVVHQKWLLPENTGFTKYNESTKKGHIVGKFSSDCGHVNLMTDLKQVGNALYSIVEAEKTWKSRSSSQGA